MILNYTEMIKIVRARKLQIEDVALEQDRFNVEYVTLCNIELQLAHLIINERKNDDTLPKT